MTYAFPNTGYTEPKEIDWRNFLLEKAQPVQPFPPSLKTDISGVPVFHQHKIPSCVENAIVFVKKYHVLKGYNLTLDLSRRFLAALTVKMDGFPISQGTSIHNALNIAHDNKDGGICESIYFSDNHLLEEEVFEDYELIPATAYENAKQHTIGSYAFLSDLTVNGLKNAINQNGLVVVGALINQNWWTDREGNVSWDGSDILPIRPPKTKNPKFDSSLSGHCFVLYGYDDKYFYFVNSFGTDWGNQGLGYFGVDEVPFIYEAATIVDLSAEQIKTLKDEIEATQIVISQINPNTPSGQIQIGLVKQLIQYLAQEVRRIFGVS